MFLKLILIVLRCWFEILLNFVFFFFLFHEIHHILRGTTFFLTIGTKTQVSMFDVHKMKYSLSKKKWRFTMVSPCIYTTVYLLKYALFWWVFVLQFTYTGMGKWSVLIHIKNIFLMDARINVNIDVFCTKFPLVRFSRWKKKSFKTYYFFLFECSSSWVVLVCVQVWKEKLQRCFLLAFLCKEPLSIVSACFCLCQDMSSDSRKFIIINI